MFFDSEKLSEISRECDKIMKDENFTIEEKQAAHILRLGAIELEAATILKYMSEATKENN